MGFGVWRWRWTLDVGENRQSRSGDVGITPLYEFILPVAAPFPEQKEEKKSKRSQPAAMFPCFSLPAVCARAIHKHKRGVINLDTVIW